MHREVSPLHNGVFMYGIRRWYTSTLAQLNTIVALAAGLIESVVRNIFWEGLVCNARRNALLLSQQSSKANVPQITVRHAALTNLHSDCK
jgi:hypothetical protein